jgi:hypothetical protein
MVKFRLEPTGQKHGPIEQMPEGQCSSGTTNAEIISNMSFSNSIITIYFLKLSFASVFFLNVGGSETIFL